MKKILFLSGLFFCCAAISNAQVLGEGQLHGSVEIDAQTYKADSLIGAPSVPEKMGLNSYAQLDYTNGKISAGVRYEAYENVLEGIYSSMFRDRHRFIRDCCYHFHLYGGCVDGTNRLSIG